MMETFLGLTVGLSVLGCMATYWGETDEISSNFGGFITSWSLDTSMMGIIMENLLGMTFDKEGHYMQGYGMDLRECRLLPIMPVFVMIAIFIGFFIQGCWMSNRKGAVRVVEMPPLHSLFRGGAGGSDSTDRKRQLTNLVSKLVNIIEKIADEGEKDEDIHPDNHQSVFLREFSHLIHRWEAATPTVGELQKSIAGLISLDINHREQSRQMTGQGFSFYKQFIKEKEEKAQQPYQGKPTGGKGFGKAKPGQKGKGPVVPRFDLAKLCPQRNMISWQRLASILEQGKVEEEASLNNAVCVLDSYYRMLELQNMAEAHGISFKTILICKTESEEFDKDDGGRCEMLPYMGNLALMKARITSLDRSEPSFRGVTPLKSEAPGLADEELVSLRIIAPLSIVEDSKMKDYLLKHPEHTLRLLKCPLDEVKTNSWSGSKGTIEGYMNIPKSKVESVLGLSGTGGIFVQRLRKDVLQLPEVDWQNQDPKDDDVAYFKKAYAAATALSLPLTFRSGRGAWLGIVNPAASNKVKCWAINGIPDSWGPSTVVQWLQSIKWEIEGQPSPPRSGKQVWQIHAKHPADDCREQYAYELQMGGNTRNLLIKRWQKHRHVEIGAKISGPKWWNSELERDPIEVDDTQVAPTVLEDTQIDATMEANTDGKTKADRPSGESPEKKRIRTSKAPSVAPSWKLTGGQRGPGQQTALLDLQGNGDCGWRVLGYMIAMTNNRWKDQTSEIAPKAEQLGISLHSKTVTYLLCKDLSWQQNWCPDPSANERTEGGKVASDLEAFKKSLKRGNRWMCGLTLAAVATQQKVSIIVFKVVDSAPTFERVAVFSGPGDLDRMPIIPVVLDSGHYYAVNKLSPRTNFPLSWVKDEGIIHIQSLIDIESNQTCLRGGGDDIFFTPIKKDKISIEDHLLRTCRSGSCSSKTQDNQVGSLLKTCSSRRSGIGSVRKTAFDKSSKSVRKNAITRTEPDLIAKEIKAGRNVVWKCRFCSFRINVNKGDSMKVIKHIRTHHHAEYVQQMEEYKKLGFGKKRGISGFGIRGVRLPSEFKNLNKEEWKQAKFVCPYCAKGHVQDLTRHEWIVAKKQHLRVCEKKPKKKVSLLRYFHDYQVSQHSKFRRSKWIHQRGATFTKRANDLAKKRGHDAVFFPVVGYSGIKVNIHMCKTCRARTGSSGWTKKCKRRSIRTFCSPSPTWWRRVAKANDWQKIGDVLEIKDNERADISKMLAKE